MEKELISVIIPVYNSQRYIHSCLDSVINQTYLNLEILVINDGSTDDTVAIVESYIRNDSRIRLINKNNEGVSKTRNRGLKEAKGEYILFVDSDDYIEPDIIENLYDAQKSGNSQLSVCRFFHTFDEYEKKEQVGITNNTTMSREEYLTYMSQGLYSVYYGALWNKLYSSIIINQNKISFPDGISMAEDFIFNLQYLEFIDKITTINEYKYHYRQDNDESITKIDNVNYLWDMAKIRYNLCIKQYKKMGMYEICCDSIQNAIANELIAPTYYIVKEKYEGFAIAKQKIKLLYNDEFVINAIRHTKKTQMVHRIAKISIKMHNYGLFVILMRIWIRIQKYEG